MSRLGGARWWNQEADRSRRCRKGFTLTETQNAKNELKTCLAGLTANTETHQHRQDDEEHTKQPQGNTDKKGISNQSTQLGKTSTAAYTGNQLHRGQRTQAGPGWEHKGGRPGITRSGTERDNEST